MQDIDKLKKELLSEVESAADPSIVAKSQKLKDLYSQIPSLPADQRGSFGAAVNQLKNEIDEAIKNKLEKKADEDVEPIDVTAPWDVNSHRPKLLDTETGSIHPLSTELNRVIDIFTRMGFEAIESRQIDDDYHMFEALNFSKNHPARDGYDTFRTEEGLIPPAHTSTMQYRILQQGKEKLEQGGEIAAISYGRVFRNEDVDATHEHTFYQCEGVYVSQTATLGDMLGILRAFFETYYGQSLNIKTQPGYFPFVEPGLEFKIEKPAVLGGKTGEWLEMLGCGMIHPNVLETAGIDSNKYRGFAWGGGIDRLVMLKYSIEDLRHFESGRLAFLRKFKS